MFSDILLKYIHRNLGMTLPEKMTDVFLPCNEPLYKPKAPLFLKGCKIKTVKPSNPEIVQSVAQFDTCSLRFSKRFLTLWDHPSRFCRSRKCSLKASSGGKHLDMDRKILMKKYALNPPRWVLNWEWISLNKHHISDLDKYNVYSD